MPSELDKKLSLRRFMLRVGGLIGRFLWLVLSLGDEELADRAKDSETSVLSVRFETWELTTILVL
jgi:hypothetical protein